MTAWTLPERKYPRYLILKEKRVTVFGPIGSISEWNHWDSFKTAEERDTELKNLRERHPDWRLKAVDEINEGITR